MKKTTGPNQQHKKDREKLCSQEKKTEKHLIFTMLTNTYRINDNHLKEARLPLLSDETVVSNDPGDGQNAFQRYALSLGLTFGTFMQLSILGTNSLVHSLWGPETLHTTMGKIGLQILYSVVTSTMSLIVLALIHNLVSIAYQQSRTNKSEDAALQDLLRKLEGCFITGALSGVCAMAWITTNLIFVQRQLTVFPIIMTLMSYYAFFYYYHSINNDNHYKNPNYNNDDEDEQTTEEGLYHRQVARYWVGAHQDIPL
jgi:hypothetical protein